MNRDSRDPGIYRAMAVNIDLKTRSLTNHEEEREGDQRHLSAKSGPVAVGPPYGTIGLPLPVMESAGRSQLALNRRSLCNDCGSKFKGQIATNRVILHDLNRGNRKPSKLTLESQIVRAVIARMMAVPNAHGAVFVLVAATAPERRTEVVLMR